MNNTVITLEREKTPVVSSLPGASTVHMNGKFQIRELHLFTVLETEFGLTVTWDRGTRLYITLDPKFKGQLVRFQYMIYALLTSPLYRNVFAFKWSIRRMWIILILNFHQEEHAAYAETSMVTEMTISWVHRCYLRLYRITLVTAGKLIHLAQMQLVPEILVQRTSIENPGPTRCAVL